MKYELSDNVNCLLMWTVGGCEMSEENCQKILPIREYDLWEDVSSHKVWIVNVCEQSEDVNC